jgi:hypothetical protein
MAKKPKPDLTLVRTVTDNAAEPPAIGCEGDSGRRPPRRQPPALPPGSPVMPLGMMGDTRYLPRCLRTACRAQSQGAYPPQHSGPLRFGKSPRGRVLAENRREGKN